MSNELVAIHKDFRRLEKDFSSLRGEFHDFREELTGEFHEFRIEMKTNYNSFTEEINRAVSRVEVMYEDTRDDIKRMLEGFESAVGSIKKIPALDSGMGEVKSDLKTVKTVIRDTNLDVQDHDRRIIRLEQTAA